MRAVEVAELRSLLIWQLRLLLNQNVQVLVSADVCFLMSRRAERQSSWTVVNVVSAYRPSQGQCLPPQWPRLSARGSIYLHWHAVESRSAEVTCMDNQSPARALLLYRIE